MEVACSDNWGPVLAVNESVKTGPDDVVFEDTAWLENGAATCAVDKVAALLDREDGEGDDEETRLLKVRCARTRCRRLIFAGGVESPLILPTLSN